MKRNFQQEIATPEKVCKRSNKRLYLSVMLTAAILLSLLILTVSMVVFLSHLSYTGISELFGIKNTDSVRLSLVYGSALICLTAAALIPIFVYRKFGVTITAVCLWLAAITAIAAVGAPDSAVWIALFGILLIGSTIFFGWQYQKNKLKIKIVSTRTITVLAMFVALSIVFKMISNTISNLLIVPQLKLSISYIPWVVAGLSLGPVGGFIVGGIGDILGQLIVPTGGAPIPLLTLSNALFGVFPAIFYQYLKSPSKHSYAFDILKIVLGMLVSTIVCTMGISSVVLWKLYAPDTNFLYYVAVNRSPQLFAIVINTLIIIWLLKPLKKIKVITDKRLY